MTRRMPHPGLVKLHRTYETHELARLFKKHRNTIRNWMDLGLKPLDGKRPYLFHGEDVRAFLTEKRKSKYRRCQPNEMFCLACRSPKVPVGNKVDYLPTTATSGNLRGSCPDCGNVIHRKVSNHRFPEIQTLFQIHFPQGPLHIGETHVPCVNCDLKEQGDPHGHAQPRE